MTLSGKAVTPFVGYAWLSQFNRKLSDKMVESIPQSSLLDVGGRTLNNATGTIDGNGELMVND